jgi:hypothetical protein
MSDEMSEMALIRAHVSLGADRSGRTCRRLAARQNRSACPDHPLGAIRHTPYADTQTDPIGLNTSTVAKAQAG